MWSAVDESEVSLLGGGNKRTGCHYPVLLFSTELPKGVAQNASLSTAWNLRSSSGEWLP